MNNGPIDRYRFEPKVPEGDDKHRLVCGDCGWIHYENPKIVVGAVVYSGEKILLCRRAIEPRRGFWTIPAGYMEAHETCEHGARREAYEEARAEIELEVLLGVYSVPQISQVHMFYRARLLGDSFSAGPESLEVKLFTWAEIPWGDLAFPTGRWVLDHFQATKGRTDFQPFSAPS